MANSGVERRWGSLDVLRAVAVLLVLGEHFQNAAPRGSWLWLLLGSANWVGWSGVDLFLALSGFLISNLLFHEYRTTGIIAWKRFLTRRAFKIYPGFYLLIALSLTGAITPQCEVTAASVAGELFFLQNYIGLLWRHSWSLALEEHFYLSITTLVALPCRDAIVRHWPLIVAGVAVGCLGSRVVMTLSAPFDWDTHLQRSHVRIDGLFLGSLAGWLFNFRGEIMANVIKRRRSRWNTVTIILIAAGILPRIDSSLFGHTIGMTFLAMGFSMLTIGAVCGAWPELKGAIPEAAQEIGRCSYAIYLWHLAVLLRWLPYMEATYDLELPLALRFALYVSASLCMGIFMTRLVEMPFLKLREKLLPAREVHAVGRVVAEFARSRWWLNRLI